MADIVPHHVFTNDELLTIRVAEADGWASDDQLRVLLQVIRRLAIRVGQLERLASLP